MEPFSWQKGTIWSSRILTLWRFLQLQHSLSPRVLLDELGHNSRLIERCIFDATFHLPPSFVIGYDFNHMADIIPPHTRIYSGDPLRDSGLQSFSAPFNFELIHPDRQTTEGPKDLMTHSLLWSMVDVHFGLKTPRVPHLYNNDSIYPKCRTTKISKEEGLEI